MHRAYTISHGMRHQEWKFGGGREHARLCAVPQRALDCYHRRLVIPAGERNFVSLQLLFVVYDKLIRPSHRNFASE
jgi:hypothetical protein